MCLSAGGLNCRRGGLVCLSGASMCMHVDVSLANAVCATLDCIVLYTHVTACDELELRRPDLV